MTRTAPTSERSAPRFRALRGLRARARATPAGRLAWRIAITVVGVLVIAGGVVLLPLPGPGWLVIFAGIGVLGTEYVWARRLLGWGRAQVRRWTLWLAAQPLWVRVVVALASLIVLAALALAAWFVRP